MHLVPEFNLLPRMCKWNWSKFELFAMRMSYRLFR